MHTHLMHALASGPGQLWDCPAGLHVELTPGACIDIAARAVVNCPAGVPVMPTAGACIITAARTMWSCSAGLRVIPHRIPTLASRPGQLWHWPDALLSD